ncbi:hypothetical protein NDA18_000545 [Ustilago nuda]|nr:hypothetical protein NDA18_000545 [Ustilago nuda]
MPRLFSRRTKGKGPSQINSASGYLGAISSADIDRLGLSSPTPSTADAQLLPNVPTKDDLPAPPPKNPAASQHDPYNNHQASFSSTLTLQTTNTTAHSNGHGRMDDFGQMQALTGSKSTTFASSSRSNNYNTLLQAPSASTLVAASSSVYANGSKFTRKQSSSSFMYDASSSLQKQPSYAYGYTTEAWHVQLEASRALALLEACGDQIRNRGLDNPLIFSSMALDLSPTNVASLIKLFASTSGVLPSAFVDEIRFANPHDLAAVIKWAFARMDRVLAVPVPVPGAKKGEVREEMVYVQQRGFLDLESYHAWREQERRQHYTPTAFKDFLGHLKQENAKLLSSLFSLLSSTASYSLKNGMMPAKLSKHFGVLLFGLPEDETFARTYDAYVRASNATEHLLLAYIRYQATQEALPPRLAQHVSGYPSILPAEMALPSTSSKLVPITQIERNVRLYSVDLVQSACEMDLEQACKEWEHCLCVHETLGKDPQLSDKFRKLINLRGGATQGRKPGSKANDPSVGCEDDDAVAAHSSLAGKRWDDFLSDGFSAPDSSKLAFDLNESARMNRIAGNKRDTVQWNIFSANGFHPDENQALAKALSFDDVLKRDVQNWPSERDMIHAKLKSKSDKLPAFNYDTRPRLLTSPSLAGVAEGKMDNHPISRMDETFADVWADYLLGNGWSNRDELTHRNANFVVVQYKSRPNESTVGSQSAGSTLSSPTSFRKVEGGARDDRKDAAWFVVQEVVPAQYRLELGNVGQGEGVGRAMMRKLNMFRSKKDKSSSSGNGGGEKSIDMAGDDVFKAGSGGSTKRIVLSDQLKRNGSRNASRSSLRSNRTSMDKRAGGGEAGEDHSTVHSNGHAHFKSEGHQQSSSSGSGGGNKLMSTLRAKSMKVVHSARRGASSPALNSRDPILAGYDEFGCHPTTNHARAGEQEGDVHGDRSFTSADFETRSIGDSDSISLSPARKRRGDKAWIDILVRANGNRLEGPDVPRPYTRTMAMADDTAQLSTVDAGLETGASTPRLMRGSGGSVETFEAHHSNGVPRSSTPPLTASNKATPETDHAEEFPALERIESASNSQCYSYSAEPSTQCNAADGSFGVRTARSQVAEIAMGEASLSPSASMLQPEAALDHVAAARAALKSRKEAPPRPAASIDTKKLVESLRAGLSPIEAVRASKEGRSVSPSSPLGGDTSAGSANWLMDAPSAKPAAGSVKGRGYRDPFVKDPVAGRVADVASKFGGRAGASSIPVLKGNGVGGKGDLEKPLPAVVQARTATTATARAGTEGIGAAMLTRASMDSRVSDDEIYPEDAASNFDPRERYQTNSTDSPLIRNLELSQAEEEGEMEQLDNSTRWQARSAEWEAAESGEAPTRFAQPYQPGMPLDNVLEESESVVSSSINL